MVIFFAALVTIDKPTSDFLDWMPFLSPNQQYLSTEKNSYVVMLRLEARSCDETDLRQPGLMIRYFGLKVVFLVITAKLITKAPF